MTARFECTTHAARRILSVIRHEGIGERVIVNPDGHVDPDTDIVHVVDASGEPSGHALHCSPLGIMVEAADGEVLAQGPSYSLDDMVENFLRQIREEFASPSFSPA